MREMQDENLPQVRVERSETTEPPAATARRASEASHPARPTNVERRPKGAFLLCVKCKFFAGWRCAYPAYNPDAALARPTILTLCLPGLQPCRRPGKPAPPGMSYACCVSAASKPANTGVTCFSSYTTYKSAGIRSSSGRNVTPGHCICA